VINCDLVNNKGVLKRAFGSLLNFLQHLLVLMLRHAKSDLLNCLIVRNSSGVYRLLRRLIHSLSSQFLRFCRVLSDNEFLALHLFFHDN
jgi:hypothetical protein